jgi:hypothetical protein
MPVIYARKARFANRFNRLSSILTKGSLCRWDSRKLISNVIDTRDLQEASQTSQILHQRLDKNAGLDAMIPEIENTCSFTETNAEPGKGLTNPRSRIGVNSLKFRKGIRAFLMILCSSLHEGKDSGRAPRLPGQSWVIY